MRSRMLCGAHDAPDRRPEEVGQDERDDGEGDLDEEGREQAGLAANERQALSMKQPLGELLDADGDRRQEQEPDRARRSPTDEPREAEQEQCAERAKERRHEDGSVFGRLAGLRAHRAARLATSREVSHNRRGRHDEHAGHEQDTGSRTEPLENGSVHPWHRATIGSRTCHVKAKRRGLDATTVGARHPTRRTPPPRMARRPGGSRTRRTPGRLPQRPARTRGSGARGRRRRASTRRRVPRTP
jgi:hypothetical protein